MSTDRRGGKLGSILGLKCPRCRKAKLFKTPSLSFRQPFEMKDRCEVCGQDFHIEPGFYYGAMFISYIFMAWFSLGFAGFFHWVLKWDLLASFTALIVFIAIFFVYIFRVARSAWIGINVRYNPST